MKTKHFVRQSLFYLSLIYLLLLGAPERSLGENLPAIDAREFQATPMEASKSGRVYRFKTDGLIPRTGNIILIEIENRPIMAFRVLSTSASTNEFIGKRVRRYDVEGNLNFEKAYSAVEKIADLVSPPETNTEATPGTGTPVSDELPAGETSKEPEEKLDPNAPPLLGDDGSGGPVQQSGGAKSLDKFDEELDASTSPRNLEKASATDDEDSATPSEGGDKPGPIVEERENILKFRHMAGASVGLFRNMSGFSIPGTQNYGFTAYYNEVIDQDIWIKSQSAPRDTLALEGGIGYYARVNFSGAFDTYYILPIRAEMLYSVYFSEKFALLAELGAQFNWVISADAPLQTGLNALNGIQGNVGAGMLYNIGPQWYLRADLGLDRIVIGLAVKW